MATNNKSTVTEVQAKEAPAREIKAPDKPKQAESVYTAEQLAKAHNTFGTSYAIVATALQIAGKDTATVSEAKEIIEKFKKQEVK